MLSGVQHEIRLHEEACLGYEKCLNPEHYYRKDLPQSELYTWQDELAAQNAISYLKQRKKTDRPFFLAVGFGCTHREYPRVPEGYEADYVQVPKALPNLPEIRKDMAGMQIAVETVDRLCGEILNALKETGEYEETVILFTTDHGLPFPMMKCNLYDDGIGVAFLLRYPGMPEKHCVKDTLLSQVDVFPTHMDDSLSKEVFHENGYFEKKLAKEELYDLMLDPQERENLAEEMEHQAVKEEMEKILTDWQKKTKDPLHTEQKIELPEGAICCTVDSYSTKTQVILPECRKYLADLRGVLQNNIK